MEQRTQHLCEKDTWLHLRVLDTSGQIKGSAIPVASPADVTSLRRLWGSHPAIGGQHSLQEILGITVPLLLKLQPEAPWLWRIVRLSVAWFLMLLYLSHAVWCRTGGHRNEN